MPPLFKKIIPGQSPTVNLNGAVRGGVRHPVPYAGSTDPDDLMDLYVGNTHYRKINRYMRAEDHQEGVNEILDEMVVRDGRKPLPMEKALLKATGEQEAANHYLSTIRPIHESFKGNYLDDLVNSSKPVKEFYSSPAGQEFFADAGYDSSAQQYTSHAQRLLSKPIKDRANELSSWMPMREEAEQVVASIPHINQVLTTKPRFYERPGADGEVAQKWLNGALNGDTPDDVLEQMIDLGDVVNNKLASTGGSLWDANQSMTPEGNALLQDIASGKQRLTDDKLYRGLHFKNPQDYDNFVAQNQPGKIVEYPAFTSSTSNESIRDYFSGNRSGEHPVLMEIESPAQGRWVDNPAEQEYLYPANSRFEIIGSEPLAGNMPGTKLIARETVAQTPVENKTSGLMSRLKGKAFVPEPTQVAAEELLNEHLAKASRL